MSPTSSESLRESYARDGYVVVPQVLSREECGALVARTEGLMRGEVRDTRVRPNQIQTQFGAGNGVKMVKLSQLTASDPVFGELASRPSVVDVVETLIGPGARIFRDVLIVKPGRTGGPVSYHQDSAYWDVEPKALVSCWVALTDVAADGSCLEVIPGTHDRSRPHGLYLRGRHPLPQPVVSALRKAVSYAGTGDNPGEAGGSTAVWKLKRLVLAQATRYLPVLGDLQDYRVRLEEVASARTLSLPLRAGDAVFFHSLLLHATGPNRSERTRYAPIISYMSRDARFVGRGKADFRPARREQAA
ncbi:phytanoyl-CoA dioxygenase family protein [Archangium sp.]|jgi:ectoine hydroxylase-related dioxygenase (phytanoyl-CoA dioxygenase family)|uniref:phytanoyl-CoA dioxygenase family protein n=1 Tax=Archangium sp. TaxID=1872627 RepID=UPI002EDA55DF